MSTPKIYQGAIRQWNSNWVLTDDLAALSIAETQDIIWATTPDELMIELSARHPAPDPELTMLNGGDYGYQYQASISEYPIYNGKDPARFASLLQAHGTIRIPYHYSDALKATPIIRDNVYWLDTYVAEWNPQKVQQIRADARARHLASPISRQELGSVANQVVSLLRDVVDIEWLKINENLPTCCKGMLRYLWIFDQFHGKGKYRRLTSFHKLCASWKERRAATVKRWGHRAELLPFIAWMDVQVKRLPAATPFPTLRPYSLGEATVAAEVSAPETVAISA